MTGRPIRKAGPEDAGAMARLHALGFPGPWAAAEFERFLEDGAAAFLAEGAEGPIGFLLLRLAGGEGEVLTLCVDPAERQKGWGRALLDAALQAGQEAGAEAIFLEVGEGNTPARALYRSAGFVSLARRPNYYLERDGAGRPAGRSAAVVMRASIL